MRILLLSQFYPPVIGGEERHVKVLAETLTARGHKVAVATIRQGDEPVAEVLNNAHIYRLQGTLQRGTLLFKDHSRRHAPPFPDPELTLRLARLTSSFAPDVVHAHNWLLHSYLPLSLFARSRFVVTLHDYGSVCAKKNLIRDGEPCAGPQALQCLPCAGAHYGATTGAATWFANLCSNALALKAVDNFIAVSPAVAERCGLEAAQVPYVVLPRSYVRQLSPERDECLGRLPGDGYLLFVGDLMYLKGLHMLLEAYQGLQRAP